MIKLEKFVTYEGREKDWIAQNSLDTTGWDKFVTVSGEFINAATAGSRVDWVSLTRKAFTSDNQTVAKARIGYIPSSVNNTYWVTITWGTITISDDGKYYNLTDAVTVDWTTESTVPYYTNTSDTASATDPLITMQLKLVKFVSSTYSQFEIVSLK